MDCMRQVLTQLVGMTKIISETVTIFATLGLAGVAQVLFSDDVIEDTVSGSTSGLQALERLKTPCHRVVDLTRMPA